MKGTATITERQLKAMYCKELLSSDPNTLNDMERALQQEIESSMTLLRQSEDFALYLIYEYINRRFTEILTGYTRPI